MSPPGDRALRVAAIVVLLVSFAVRLLHIDLSYADPYSVADEIYARSHMIAVNHDRYGFAETLGRAVLNPKEVSPEHWRFYVNHPPFFTMAQGALMQVFGTGYWVGRLLPLAGVVGLLIFLWRLLARSFDRTSAWCGTAVFSLWPMNLLYAGQNNFETLCLLAIVGFAERWQAGRKLQAAAVVFLGGLVDFVPFWTPFLFCLGLLAFGLTRRDRLMPALRDCSLLGVAVFASIGAFWLHISLVEHDLVSYLRNLTLDSDQIREDISFSWFGLLTSQGEFAVAGFGWIALLWTAVGFSLWRPGMWCVLLLATGLAMVLAFPYHAFLHSFWLIYLGPGLTYGLCAASSRLRRHPAWGHLLLLALLLGSAGESLYRYGSYRGRIAYDSPARWARILEGALPADSVAILTVRRPGSPSPRCIELETDDLAVIGYLSPDTADPAATRGRLQSLARELDAYGLSDRRAFLVIERGNIADFLAAAGEPAVRRFLAEEVQGREFAEIAAPDGDEVFWIWDVTQQVFPR